MIRRFFSIVFFLMMFSASAANLSLSTSLTAPGDGCELPASNILTVYVINNELTPYSGSIEVTYSLNGGPVVSEWISTLLGPSAVFIYSFTATLDLTACQAHSIECHVNITGDTDLSNNTQTYTVISDCAPVTGTITAPTEVCENLNSGNLILTGYTGNIVSWIYSTDAGSTWSTAGNSPSQPYSNINVPMEWAVVLSSPFGLCPNDTTAWVHIDIVPQTIAGNLPPDFDICSGANGGVLNLTGYLGAILGWEFSQDGGITWNPVSNTTDTENYLNLNDTTLYQVQVQNGICPAVYTSPVTLTLVPGSDAGSIAGESLVCNFENDSSLLVTPVNGSVIGWNISYDYGTTWTTTSVTGNIYDYAGLTGYTLFAALVQAGSCPVDTVYHSIVVLPLGSSAGADVTITEGDSIQLMATGGTYFSWSPATNMSDPLVSDPTVWPLVTTEYFVAVTDINGCTDTASVTVTVKPDLLTLNIPNMITPNGDGFNDILVIENIESYPKNEILIFNTYGQVIFRASPYNNDWTASFKDSDVPDGTYYYVLDLNDDTYVQNEYQGVITVMGRR